MIFLLAAVLIFLTDFGIKTWIEAARKSEFPVRLAGGRIELIRRHNHGLAGSCLENRPNLALGLSGCAFLLGALNLIPRFFRRGDRSEKLASALILGGAASNLFDRLGRGYVVDYLTFPKARLRALRRFVYNLSDLLIFLGCGLSVLRGLRKKSGGR